MELGFFDNLLVIMMIGYSTPPFGLFLAIRTAWRRSKLLEEFQN